MQQLSEIQMYDLETTHDFYLFFCPPSPVVSVSLPFNLVVSYALKRKTASDTFVP